MSRRRSVNPEVTAIRHGLEHLNERAQQHATPGNLLPVPLGTIEAADADPCGDPLYRFEGHAIRLKEVARAGVELGRRVDAILEQTMFGQKLIAETFRRHTPSSVGGTAAGCAGGRGSRRLTR